MLASSSMVSVPPKFRSKVTTLHLRAPAGPVKMPLAQAHPFEPMPVTHEDTTEVSHFVFVQLFGCLLIELLASCHLMRIEEVCMRIEQYFMTA